MYKVERAVKLSSRDRDMYQNTDDKGSLQKEKTEKSDIVHIWIQTHPTLPISDIEFSDIYF